MFNLKNIILLTTFQFGAYSGVRYFFPLISPILYLMAIIYRGNSYFPKNLIYYVGLYFPVILIACFTSIDIFDLLFSFTKVILPIALFAITYSAFYNKDHNTARIYVSRLVKASVLIGILECAIRYRTALSKGSNILENFYLAKIDSPFFNDSNAVALFLITSLLLTATIKSDNRNFKYFIATLFVLILLTLSRAAIIGAVIFLFVNALAKLSQKIRFIILLFILLISILCVPILYTGVSSDGSGSTKIQIYSVFVTKLFSNEMGFLRVWFGDGMSLGAYTYGYEEGKFSHALIPMLIGQVGILGALFWSLFVLLSLYHLKFGLILSFGACIFIPGLSYAHPFYEFFYVALGIATSTKTWKSLDNEKI